MKKEFKISLLVASLLLTSTSLFASAYRDSVAKKEQTALSNPASINSKNAQKNVQKYTTKEDYLAKVKAGEFRKEVNKEEKARLQRVINGVMQSHKAALKKAPQEFMLGLNETIKALQFIKANETTKAQDALKKADKDFVTAFKKEPKLNLIPVTDNAEIISFNGSAALIQHIKDAAVKLLEDNNTQLAIDMLVPLQDEMIIKTQYVPAYLYPKAVKEALKELKSGKKDAAFSTIITALDASQLNTVIIPIPLISAQDMVLEASKLEKKDKTKALKLLSMAQDELQKAVLLGYTHEYEKSYKDIQKQIEGLKKEIKGKNIVRKLYEDLLKSFQKLEEKHQTKK
jgi:hypothetical protein